MASRWEGGMTLVMRIRRFLDRTGMKETVFGRRVLNDPRLFDDLRKGRQPRAATVQRIEAFLSSHAEGGR